MLERCWRPISSKIRLSCQLIRRIKRGSVLSYYCMPHRTETSLVAHLALRFHPFFYPPPPGWPPSLPLLPSPYHLSLGPWLCLESSHFPAHVLTISLCSHQTRRGVEHIVLDASQLWWCLIIYRVKSKPSAWCPRNHGSLLPITFQLFLSPVVSPSGELEFVLTVPALSSRALPNPPHLCWSSSRLT